jgi:hypothetical protein
VVEEKRMQTLTARDRCLVAVAAGALAALYFATRTQYHNYDSIATATVTDCPAAGTFLHQNHLLFAPEGWLVLQPLRALGYAGSSLAPAAALSAALAAGAAALFFLFLRRLDVHWAVASVVTAAAALSPAWWYLAGEAELLSGISFTLAGALWLLARRGGGWQRAMGIGLWLAVGTWYHVTVALFFPVALILVAAERQDRGSRLVALAATYVVLGLGAYLVVYRAVFHPMGWRSFYEWFTMLHWWLGWGQWEGSRFGTGLIRLLTAVGAPGSLAYARFDQATEGEIAARLGPGAAYLAAVAATVIFAAGRLWREKRRWLVAGVTWFAIYQGFFSWWEPTNVEWWIATAMPLWVLFALAVPPRRGVVAVAAAAVAVLAGVNFTRMILPNSRMHDQEEAGARAIVAASRPGDAVIMSPLRTRIWVDNLSRHTRKLIGVESEEECGRLEELAREPWPAGTCVYLTAYELDNPALGCGPAAESARRSVYRLIEGGEPAGIVYVGGRSRLLYRSYGPAPCPGLRIYEAERGTRSDEFRTLRETGNASAFNIKVPEEGRYVVRVQARGTFAGGEWPTVRVVVDGKVFSTFDVKTDYWWFYDAKAVLEAGKHTVKIVLRNGFRAAAAGEKRFVYINRLALYRDAGEGSPF